MTPKFNLPLTKNSVVTYKNITVEYCEYFHLELPWAWPWLLPKMLSWDKMNQQQDNVAIVVGISQLWLVTSDVYLPASTNILNMTDLKLICKLNIANLWPTTVDKIYVARLLSAT